MREDSILSPERRDGINIPLELLRTSPGRPKGSSGTGAQPKNGDFHSEGDRRGIRSLKDEKTSKAQFQRSMKLLRCSNGILIPERSEGINILSERTNERSE